MNEWKEFLIEDLAEFCNAKRVPLSSMQRQQLQGSYPYYGASGIVDYVNDYIFEGSHVLISEDGENLKSRNTPIAFEASGKFWVNNHAHILKAKEPHLTKILIHYFAQLDLTPYLTGAVQPKLNKATLSKIPLYLPSSTAEQKAIASVLSSLDDKIDLLHRQNKTLEAMAETLFRQWFIEEAKEDWEEVQVKEVTTLNRRSVGKNYIHGDILYLDTGSLTKGVVGELQSYSLNEAPSRAKRLVQHNDILISTVRPNQCHYGIVSEPKDNLVVSTGFCTITCETISPYFVYLLLTNTEMTEYLHSIAEGSTSTYPSLKPEDIGAVVFQMPPKELLQQFHNLAESYWQKIHSNHKQIQTLENLRDTLLPKLMSGEVRVQYQTEEVA